jgi:hypothetical protein
MSETAQLAQEEIDTEQAAAEEEQKQAAAEEGGKKPEEKKPVPPVPVEAESDKVAKKIQAMIDGKEKIPAEEKKPAPLEGVKEEDEKDMPASLQGDVRVAFIKERIKLRKAREAWQADKAEYEAKLSAAQKPSQEKAAEPAKEVTDEQLIEALSWGASARAVLDGEYNPKLSADKAKEVVKLATIALRAIDSPQRLEKIRAAVLAKADDSSDTTIMLELLEKEVPFVNARWSSGRAEAQAAEQAQKEIAGKMQAALNSEFERHPEFKGPVTGQEPSREHVFALDYFKNMEAEEVAKLYQDPAKRLPVVMKRIRAEYLLETNEKTKAELAELKKMIEAGKSPLSAGPGAGGIGGKTGTTAEDIKNKIIKDFAITEF